MLTEQVNGEETTIQLYWENTRTAAVSYDKVSKVASSDNWELVGGCDGYLYWKRQVYYTCACGQPCNIGDQAPHSYYHTSCKGGKPTKNVYVPTAQIV